MKLARDAVDAFRSAQTEDGPAAALAASMMAETNTPMAPVVA